MTDTRAPGYGQIDRDYAMRLATTPPDDDGPIWMVKPHGLPRPCPLRRRGDGHLRPEADDRYAPLDVPADIGAEVVFVGEVEDQSLGDALRWDRIGVVKYASRRSFIEMQSRADFQERHVHKEAGLARTIVAGCTPIPSPADQPDAPDLVEWSEVPHPPTDDDGPAMVLHVIRFQPGKADTDMVSYQNHAANVAVPHGVRISGWFAVEGTIVGDGRRWDQIRFNLFPSKAAFMAVVMDPARLEAQANHREVAIADTYAMIVRPTINRLEESVAEGHRTVSCPVLVATRCALGRHGKCRCRAVPAPVILCR